MTILPAVISQDDIAIIERLALTGDLTSLTPEMRMRHYMARCEALGLDPRTKPFDYIKDKSSGKTVLYPNATAAQQIGRQMQLSSRVTLREWLDKDTYMVECEVSGPGGRAVRAAAIRYMFNTSGSAYAGQQRANKMMGAETSAHRRAVAAYCGFALPDADEDQGELLDTDQLNAGPTEAQVRVFRATRGDGTLLPEDAQREASAGAPALTNGNGHDAPPEEPLTNPLDAELGRPPIQAPAKPKAKFIGDAAKFAKLAHDLADQHPILRLPSGAANIDKILEQACALGFAEVSGKNWDLVARALTQWALKAAVS